MRTLYDSPKDFYDTHLEVHDVLPKFVGYNILIKLDLARLFLKCFNQETKGAYSQNHKKLACKLD
jgi:hypothetical protein